MALSATDWLSAAKAGWREKSIAAAVQHVRDFRTAEYNGRELARRGDLPAQASPTKPTLWAPLSDERQKQPPVLNYAKPDAKPSPAVQADRELSETRAKPAETALPRIVSTGPWHAHRVEPYTQTRTTISQSAQGYHYSHETRSPKGTVITPWSQPTTVGDVTRESNESRYRIVAPSGQADKWARLAAINPAPYSTSGEVAKHLSDAGATRKLASIPSVQRQGNSRLIQSAKAQVSAAREINQAARDAARSVSKPAEASSDAARSAQAQKVQDRMQTA